MKLVNDDHIVESSGISESGDFTIKTNAAAFQLLSSGLYSNKIRAVIRELSCNAVDAHAMNGQQSVPIEVKLPNELDTQFYVKDFGPGMSHDQIMRLYTTYFDSTKRDSNDFIGGFGVGSKSPFAYTDSFTVEARQNGKVRTYTAYVDEGFPKIAVMAEQDTDEPSGLTVRFPVKPADFSRFNSEALEVFKWFRQKPVLLGTADKIPEMNYMELSPKIYIQDYTKTMTGIGSIVRMGDVVYPLTKYFSQLEENDPDRAALEWIKNRQILLDAPIGSISVAASREDLAYDKPTLSTVRKMLTEGYRLALDEVVDRVCKLDNSKWSDRRQGYQLLHATGLSALMTQVQLDRNAQLVRKQTVPLLNTALIARGISPGQLLPFLNASEPLNWDAFDTLKVSYASVHKNVHQWEELARKGVSHHGRDMPEPSRDVVVLVDDVPVKSTWATKAWKAWSNTHLKNQNRYVFVISPKEGMLDTPEFEAEKAKVLSQLCSPKELPPLSSGLAANDLAALQKRAARSFVGTTYFSNRSTRVYEGKSFCWIPERGMEDALFHEGLSDAQKQACSDLMDKLTGFSYTSDTGALAIKTFMQMLGVPTTRLYKVAGRDVEMVKTMKGAKSVVELCVAALTKPETFEAIEALEPEVDIGEMSENRNPLAAVLFFSSWGSSANLKQAMQGTQLGTLVEKLKSLRIKPEESPQTKLMALLKDLNAFAGNPLELPERIVVVDSASLFAKTYPMLSSFTRNARSHDIDHMREYISWCESKMADDDILPTTLKSL